MIEKNRLNFGIWTANFLVDKIRNFIIKLLENMAGMRFFARKLI